MKIMNRTRTIKKEGTRAGVEAGRGAGGVAWESAGAGAGAEA